MRWLKRLLIALAILVVAVVVLLVGSLALDAWLGRDRVAALTNQSIPSPDGPPVRLFVDRPSADGPFPAVIMIHEFWGLRPDIVGKADALADEGYVVVAPDTYRGASTGWIPRAIYQSLRTSQARVDTDLDTVFAWLAAQPDVDADRIAIVGFCYGGRVSLRYSLHNDEIASTVVFYGSPVTEPERLARLPGPVLGIFGGADTSIPIAEVEAFERALAQAGVSHDISIYEGQGHAFVTSIEAIRAGGAPGEAWAEMLAFLDATLR